MVNKLFSVAAAAGFAVVTAVFVTATTLPAEASLRGMPCKEAAKVKYPDDRHMRHAWKKLCKANWELHQG